MLALKKAALVLLWLAALAGFFVQIQTTAALVARGIFVGLVVIRSIQWLAFRNLLEGSPNGTIGDLTGTFLFGMLHVQEVRAEVEAKSSES